MESRGIDDINRFIERYTEERQHSSKQVALQHLFCKAYLGGDAGEADLFLKRVRKYLLIDIETMNLFDNPLYSPQGYWLIFIPFGFFFSLHMADHPETALLALIYCAATVIYGTSLFIMVIHKWFDTTMRIDYYREIIDFIDSQQAQ